MAIEFDIPSVIVGSILAIISLAYWTVELQGIPVSKFMFGAGIFLIIIKPVITLVVGGKDGK